MIDEVTGDREAVLAAVAAAVTPEEAQAGAEAEERAQLEQRRLDVAPEAHAGDPEALAELERVNADLAALDERQSLRALAGEAREQRDRAAADAEAERQREAWRAEQAQAETERDAALAAFEKAFPAALAHARDAFEANERAQILQGQIEPGTALQYLRLTSPVENRILYLIHAALGRFYVKPGIVRDGQGSQPLVEATPKPSRRRTSHKQN